MRLPFVCTSLLSFFTVWSNDEKNNVCRSFIEYNFKSSKGCYHHPDADTVQPEIIIKNHAPNAETYNITTEDGYILTLLRIPRENPLGVVCLGHPVLVDGIIWISEGNNSLAFLAWKAGYDVWILSNRGTTLSPAHQTLSVKSVKYWDFSFHEMGKYDYPAIVDFIYDKTRVPMVLVGHSTGSTSALIYASLFPEDASKKVKLFINMATAANFKYLSFHIKIAATYIVPFVTMAFEFFHLKTILRYDEWFTVSCRYVNRFYPFNKLFVYVISVIGGWNPQEADPEQWGLTGPKIARGTSLKMLSHYSQLARSESLFQPYDYGEKENIKRYGQEKPPEYPLDKITAPFYFICADRDGLSAEKDNDIVYAKLPRSCQKGRFVVTNMNHFDYFIGKHRKTKLYDHVLEVIKNNI